ncbi:MAG TPA: DMT family transporter [Gaiellaceae bacterium]|nr:DMT family transporter [Gaiellaceae bacterium]
MQRFPTASFIGTIVVWASAFAVIKALIDHGIGAEQIALSRYLVAAPGFAFLLWRAGGLPGLDRRDATRLLAAGVVIVAGYHLSLNIGEESTASGVAALIVALSPALTMALAIAFGIERFSLRVAAGLAVAFAGVVVVVGLGSGEELSVSGLKGPLIVLGAPLSFALYNVLLKPLFARYDLLALTATTSLVGTVALLPIFAGSDLGGIGSVAGRDIALILYLGIFSTLLGYIGWNIGLRAFGPTRAVTATYAIPALAVLFGAVTLEEPVTAWIAVGGLLIVGGVALASFRAAGRGRGVRGLFRRGARPEDAPRARVAEPPSRAR